MIDYFKEAESIEKEFQVVKQNFQKRHPDFLQNAKYMDQLHKYLLKMVELSIYLNLSSVLKFDLTLFHTTLSLTLTNLRNHVKNIENIIE